MKIRIELVEGLEEDELLIRCSSLNSEITELQQFLQNKQRQNTKFVFYKDNQEFYFPVAEVLFFETDGEAVYAHTRSDAYRIKHRLYELEELLPRQFMRASKSSIVNLARIYSITRNITASSLVQFSKTPKELYISRHYYKALQERLNERSYHEK